MRKGLVTFCTDEDIFTKVTDQVSATLPDQALSLRELLMQYSYIGEEKLNDIVNRGWLDEDEDTLGVDVSSLDFAEVHDRLLELIEKERDARAVHIEEKVVVAPTAPDVEKTDAEPDRVSG